MRIVDVGSESESDAALRVLASMFGYAHARLQKVREAGNRGAHLANFMDEAFEKVLNNPFKTREALLAIYSLVVEGDRVASRALKGAGSWELH